MSNNEPKSRFLRACSHLPVDTTPVWLMRQAGRYMEEYRTLRAKYSMLELIQIPELAAEVTMQPINAFDLDAAIIFADILTPLIGMGLNLEFISKKGPVIYNPIDNPEDIRQLQTPPTEEFLGSTISAVNIVSHELETRGLPLIGFAGAPFTLASYAIEGGGSKDFAKTKALMYSQPEAWRELMEKLVTVQSDYLLQQAKAGADALQVFDSWVGLALGKRAYNKYVAPYNIKLFETLKSAGVPVINFSTGTFPYLEDVAACGGDVIGVDFRMPLGAAWKKIGYDRVIQGNLDPMTLLIPWSALKTHIDRVLDEAAMWPGHIFNLGHGIHKTTPVDTVKRLVDYVHERTNHVIDTTIT
ncbi:MAG: uroporphyrinogen decarboxylase [Anaerolineales bacterium]|nr:uroporphyrinogen decarboxylase [Anaerolineales bacterium]